VLRFPLIHPPLLAALAAAGHGSRVLLADANYPHATGVSPRAAQVFPRVSEASASVSDLLLEGYSARFTLGYQAAAQPFRAAVTALLADEKSASRAELERAGVKTRQAYATADLGVVAYETDGADGALLPGMLVNDDLIVEIVTPGSDEPAAAGKVGEVVVTRLQGDYPLLRFATGDLSAWASTDRLKGWMGRADQSAKVRGLFVHPGQIAEVGKRHPELGALRLVVRREGEQDVMLLSAETASPSQALKQAVATTLQALTKLRGEVALVGSGSLPNDGKIIADERPTP